MSLDSEEETVILKGLESGLVSGNSEIDLLNKTTSFFLNYLIDWL